MMAPLSRRQFLVAGAAGGAMLGLRALAFPTGAFGDAAAARAASPEYRDPGDVWRNAWRWDRVVRGTHLRANCFAACAWDIYVKDGVVWREEQSDVYERDAAGRPDFGPRGCQKGACYSDLMVSPDRVTYPLERVGARGSGKWRRISWDDALARVADAIVDASAAGAPETVIYDNGTSNVDVAPGSIGEMRLFTLLGGTLLDGFGGTGDLAMGAFQTWGTTFVDGSADDWVRADTILVWHCNPMSTRIPEAHFLTEARYRGAKIVTITPDYSPSAIHASLWVNPRQGSDAALALGLAREILAREAIDAEYVREQTDLPFLVREDTGQFLREADVEAGGRGDRFYVWDEAANELAQAPGTMGQWSGSLDLGAIRPALAGRWQVETVNGTVAVVPVLALLRTRLAEYTPEHVHRITGVAPGAQARLAERLCRSPRILIYATWGSNKTHHADLLQRSLILLSALRGQQGRPGSGVRFASWLPFHGGDELIPGSGPNWLQRQILRFYTPPPRDMESAIAAASVETLPWTPSHLFLHVHGGLDAPMDADAVDPALPRPERDYLRAALQKGWMTPRPAPDQRPRVLVTAGVNPLRRWPLPQIVERVLWPKLDMVVTIDFRLSTTAMKSDLVLPAAGYYEKRGIKYSVGLVPYVVVGDQAVAPLGESKPEWEICSLLASEIQRRARARGVGGAVASIEDEFSQDGRYGPGDDAAVIDTVLRDSPVTGGIGWEEARRRGAVPIATVGGWGVTSGIGSEVEPGGTITPSRLHVEGKVAWPTLTGRQQFFLDHPWFIEGDERLPRWKPLPNPGGIHPIRLTGGHTRWSIHATYRALPVLMRLQRGGPIVWMSEEDARARGIRDGDAVRVWNDHGSFRVHAKVSPGVGKGAAIIYHAWEPYQFPDWRGNMEVVSTPYKGLHFTGDYGHLRYRVFIAGPVHVPRAVPVDIEPDRLALGHRAA